MNFNRRSRSVICALMFYGLVAGSLIPERAIFRFTAAAQLQVELDPQTGNFTVKLAKGNLKRAIERIFELANAHTEYLEDVTTTDASIEITKQPFPEVLQRLGDALGLAFQRVLFDLSGNQIASPNVWMICQTSVAVERGKMRVYRDTRLNLASNAASLRYILATLTQLYPDGLAFAQGVKTQLRRDGVDLDKVDLKVDVELRPFANLASLTPADFIKTFLAGGAPQSPGAGERAEMEVWPLSFFPSSLKPIGNGSVDAAAEASDSDYIDTVIRTLNETYRGEASIERARQYLLIYGSDAARQKVKRTLAQIDVPWPQVQLTMWAIQVTDRDNQKTAARIREIKECILNTQADMKKAQEKLISRIRPFKLYYLLHPTMRLMRQVGFRLTPNDPLSLNEALIFLALHPQFLKQNQATAGRPVPFTQVPATDWETELKKLVGKAEIEEVLSASREKLAEQWQLEEAVIEEIQKSAITKNSTAEHKEQAIKDKKEWLLKKAAEELKVGFEQLEAQAPGYQAFSRLMESYALQVGPNRRGIEAFARAVHKFKSDKDGKDKEAPGELLRTRSVADKMLKSAIDLYYLEMQQKFLEPLLKSVVPRDGDKSRGVSLVGQTRIVVTSSLESSLEPTMSSYVETTRPKPLGSELLQLAGKAPQTSGTGTTTNTNITSSLNQIASAISQIEPGHAALIAALMSDIAPAYSKVAPGIAIHVRPTVLADGGAARLKLDCSFGVTTSRWNGTQNSQGQASNPDPWERPLADAIESHHVRTDAVISVFDLFDISSFSVETSHPQSPIYIPVLARLPVVGPAFQFPRGSKQVHHESVILVNTVILPRAIDLARFYTEGF